MNSILCDYVLSSPLGLVPKMVGILSRQTATLTHTNQRTIPHKQEFIIHSGLRLSYLGHPNEIEIELVNRVTSSDYYFVVRSYANSLHRIPSLACCIHEHIGTMCLYQIQSELYQ